MKNISLLIFLLCLASGISRAASLTGTVSNAVTGAPVAGQLVTVRDSFNNYHDSATTAFNGTYTIALPGTLANGTLLISAQACGIAYTVRKLYLGSNLTANVSVCTSTPSYNLYGTVTLGGANNGPAWLYLIRKAYNTATMDTTLTVIDSFTTAATGGTFTRTYTFHLSGALLLKAALQATHPDYISYLPTYYSNTLVWSSAAALDSLVFTTGAVNIAMIAGTNPGGPGFIGGSVLLGANKSTAVGDPLPGRLLLMTNSTNMPVSYTYSDSAGHFGFPPLPYGTYKIFGDAPSKSNPALTVTITAAKPSITNIIFEESSKTFKGRLNTLSTAASSAAAVANVAIYPNPVGDRIRFSGLAGIGGNKAVLLTDITGSTILRRSFASGEDVEVAAGALPAGSYLLHLQTTAGNAVFRIAK